MESALSVRENKDGLRGAGPRLRDYLEGTDVGGPARRRPALSGDAIDLHGAYVSGHAARLRARRGEEKPPWAEAMDPLETLFLGVAWPEYYGTAYRFANACDTWLRVLRGTPYWAGIEWFVRAAVAASTELGVPPGADEMYVPLRERLEVSGRDLRSLPRDLLPGEILRGARCFDGPARGIRLPEPPPNAGELLSLFWSLQGTSESPGFPISGPNGFTPSAGLTAGLRTLRAQGALGIPDYHSCGSVGLLKGLYAGLVLEAGERLPGDLVNRAIAWALGLPAESSLVPVVDVLLIAVERGLETQETLGYLFGVREFSRPVSAADREWRSSIGTALRRVARELGP